MPNISALGLDTSNYTTSAAFFCDGEMDSRGMILPVKEGEIGLRQSDAVFHHTRQLPEVLSMLGDKISEAKVIGVSERPRDAKDSYMPCFLVGIGAAQMLAQALGVPLRRFSHQQGHIAAGLIGNAAPEGPFVALHLSGGTTELLDCREGRLELLGGSEDLHAGQLVDRVGVALGLPFPAGPALERLAVSCPEKAAALLPASVSRDGLSCHLSGVETQAQRLIRAGELSRERIAAEVYDVLARTVARLLDGACRRTGARQALVVGGVASSALLRRLVGDRLSRLRSPVRVLYGQAQYSADNAAGVASIGMQRYLKGHS